MRAALMRVVSANSETIRPPQIALIRSSLVTTRSRCRIRYSRRSKTWGCNGMASPPRRSSRWLVSKAQLSKRYSKIKAFAG